MGGPKTAIFSQVVHFYPDAVGHITIGGNTVGMEPRQLIAQAFGGLAERAEKIGQLNLSPDLLQTLLAGPVTAEVSRAK